MASTDDVDDTFAGQRAHLYGWTSKILARRIFGLNVVRPSRK